MTAEESFREALTRAPYATPRYYNALAAFYLQSGERERAQQVYENAIERFPVNEVYHEYQYLFHRMNTHLSESYTRLALLYEEDGRIDDARDLLEHAAEIPPPRTGGER